MKTLKLTTPALALLLAAGTARAVWIGATSGTTDDDAHDYTNTNNWENGVIDDVITNTITANMTLYFKRDHATGPNGMDMRVNSSSTTIRTFALKNSGGTHTLTLNGDFVNSGSKISHQIYVPVDLAGGVRTIDTGSTYMQWSSSITNGSIVKVGSDQLRLNTSSVYLKEPVIVNQGTLYPYQAAVNYTVPTILNNAGLLFYGGSLRDTPTITLNAITGGSTLTSQSYGNGQNRLGDTVDLILVSGASGNAQAAVTHMIDATTGIDVAERIGRVILRNGQSSWKQGARYSGSTVFFRMDAGEIVREHGSTMTIINTVNVGDYDNKGNAMLGVRRDSGDLPYCGNQFFLDTPPAMIGGPVSRGTDAPIIPYMLGAFAISNNTAQTLNTLITHDAGGLRAMRTRTDLLGNPSEFVATLAAADADGKDNVRIGANETYSGETTVNALALGAGTLTLGADAKVTLGSGLLAFVGGSLTGNAGSVIDVGAREGIVINGGGKTISASLAGTGGYTFSTFNSSVKLTGTNSYSGTTTIVSGTLSLYQMNGTPHNVFLPDDGLVLIHPGATLEVGYYQSNYTTREMIGAVAGGGSLRLGWISGDETYRRSLIIGQGGTGTPGEVTLDGGTISPGMPGEVGTLSVTTEANAAGAPIPVTLKKGTLAIDITGPGVCDQLSTMTNVTITGTGELVVDVKLGGYRPAMDEEFPIIVSSNGPIVDGNGGLLFNKITDDSEYASFTAKIAADGKSVVLVAGPDQPASVILVR